MKKVFIALVCHWQFCTQISGERFICGTPMHGTEERMAGEISNVKPPRYEHHECVREGEKTPAWLRSSGWHSLVWPK